MKKAPSQLTAPALQLIVRSYLRRLGEEHRTPTVRVLFNRRLRTAIGRSDPARARIYLNPHLLDRYPSELVATLVHELCHVVAGLKAGHGARWKELMLRCGFQPTTYHDLDVSDLELRRRRWRWKCRVCDRTLVRKSRAVSRYRCGSCGGALRVDAEMRAAAR